ncbi:MAG: ATP-binding cassette domain-containing protein [Deltaproteobacteria bacterium]|nr:MAG: ATP-binding cassette domain-containing protein [Deltaproteobacteria bacterium]
MAGVTWQAMHYLAGLRALGCDVFYVEDSGAPPYDPASGGVAIDPSPNVAYLATVMRRLDLAERWAYWDAQRDVWHGLDAPQVRALYGSADAIFNLCGATRLRPEHRQGARLCYVETDPIYEQMRVANGDADSIAFLAEHDLLFTYGELLGTPSCTVPVERFTWIPTRPPVALDEWAPRDPGTAYRTIATWENKGKNVEFRGETYQWTKHLNFLRMIDVPRQARTRVELAMDPLDAGVRADLETHGWTLVDPRPISADVDAYRGFVEGLPQGLATAIGEQGATVSEGERQRITIARAILRDAPILILDEPTSALDAETEALIIAALRELMDGRTTFVIAHRLSTIRHADQILVLRDGTIAERGTFDALVDRGGTFTRLYEAQFGKQVKRGAAV